jgi:RES domain-containing protein
VENDDEDWDPIAAAAACPVVRRQGSAWRFHGRVWSADDPTGSIKVPGRWNRGWPALYLALRSHAALGEVARHLTPDRLPRFGDRYRLTEVWVEVERVLDCCADADRRESGIPGLSTDDLCRTDALDLDLPSPTQRFAAAVLERGVEGMLVPSCTRFSGGNLVLFPSQLRPGSRVQILRAEDPTLYVERSGV